MARSTLIWTARLPARRKHIPIRGAAFRIARLIFAAGASKVSILFWTFGIEGTP
jgi:hypothetical protein